MKNRNLFAYALIAIGSILVLQTFNIPLFNNFNIGSIISLIWPFFIILPALNMLKSRMNFVGVFLLILGGAFLLDNGLDIVGINFHAMSIFKFFWPAVLIYAGFKIIYSPNKHKYNHRSYPNHEESDYEYDQDVRLYEDHIHQAKEDFYKHNENERLEEKPASIAFNAKKYTYTKSSMPKGISTLNLNITFGGAEIIVEEGIQVILIGQYTMGGHEFFRNEEGGFHSEIKEVRYPEGDSDFYEQTLVIKANITFGGLEVFTM